MTTSAANGRLADSKILDALGWVSGVRLDVRQSTNLILVVTDEQGVLIINKLGRLHLPAVARNWCRLNAGDRLLLAAYPQGGLVVVHAPAAPDEVVDRVYAEALEGGVRMSKSTLDSAGFEAARPLLERMGISPSDRLEGGPVRPAAPTFAEYVPVVRESISVGTLRCCGA
jgi:bifunctional DNA-binding transcriptional regulator/antitoxin component of YhaV-PrlF toxin-antitoxin module